MPTAATTAAPRFWPTASITWSAMPTTAAEHRPISSTSTGVEMATPGQSAATAPTRSETFPITQYNDPTTGKPYAADKAGKDNNFRGLTIFNNTLYVTKGSGSNGINTVYQVGTAGTLPTLANAASAPITVLPASRPRSPRTPTRPQSIPSASGSPTPPRCMSPTRAMAPRPTPPPAPTPACRNGVLVNGTWQLASTFCRTA